MTMKVLKTSLIVITLLTSLFGSSWTLNASCTIDEECSEFENVGVCNEITGMCTCNDTLPEGCFEVSERENMCVLTSCGNYLNNSDICRVGDKKRLTALLLSIFLINFGAANFYIQRYGLAIPQILLGLLLCVFQFGSCGASAFRSDHEKTSVPCILCCSVNAFLSLAIFSWWLADLIIFALNDRNDGNGCPLYT